MSTKANHQKSPVVPGKSGQKHRSDKEYSGAGFVDDAIDVTGKKIIVPSSDTATTLGAVILAGVGIGMYKSFEEAVEKTVEIKRTHEPDPKNREVYDRNYETYLKLYDHLKDIMAERSR